MSQPTAPATLEDHAAALVMYSARLGRAVSRRTATDVPAATLRLLSQVDELGPVGISQLAHADRCSQPTMSGGVQNLVDKGWALKRPNPKDARSSLVELTATGATVLREARRRNGAVVAERLAADPCHDRDDLEAAVRLLQHLLQPAPDEGPP
ncbi:MAG TPA: MarR family winged helix-turn-helix transcriptional regulator [Nocardioidaceae bacterium]|nr:MarR family winged helix-turn-helix transcriptional regulator [Nocardioidaceae bacterium]